MTPFHLNLGRIFAQPYESDYAIVRRCLVANPGIPLSLITVNLRKVADQEGSGLMRRLRGLQKEIVDMESRTDHIESVTRRRTYERQCPQCARQLYHSDLYILPWLMRCPIHHCELVTDCPECQLPWPNEKEMTSRTCNVCGLLSVNHLNKAISAIKSTDYQPISDVWHVVDKKEWDGALRIYDLDFTFSSPWGSWWENVPIASIKYPSLHAAYTPEITRKKMVRLGIKNFSCRRRITKLFPIEDAHERIERNNFLFYRTDRFKRDTTKRPLQIVRAEFEAMRYIVDWIFRHTPESHRIHIVSQRYSDLDHYFLGPNPCPYCMALSLWFFHVAAHKYGAFVADRINDYPFWSGMERGSPTRFGSDHGFYTGCIPTINIGSEYFNVEAGFSFWFYRRGLEISFLDIINLSFILIGYLDKYRNSSEPKSYYHNEYRNTVYDCQYYSTIVIDGHLHFCYENEHPIDEFSPMEIPNIGSSCEEFKEYHERRSIDRNIPILGEISGGKLTYNNFVSLHLNFKKYLQQLWPDYIDPYSRCRRSARS